MINPFPSEGEVVRAINASRDLGSIVQHRLELFRKYTNGWNGVTVYDQFWFRVNKPHEKVVSVTIFKRAESHHSRIEEITEGGYGWGCGDEEPDTHRCVTWTEERYEQQTIHLPLGWFLMEEKAFEDMLINQRDKKEREKQEAKRLARIKELEDELKELEDELKELKP